MFDPFVKADQIERPSGGDVMLTVDVIRGLVERPTLGGVEFDGDDASHTPRAAHDVERGLME